MCAASCRGWSPTIWRCSRPDRPLWAGLLTAQGKALFDFILWADGEDVLIDCEAEQAEALARRLTLYRLRRPIAIAQRG